jgi:dTDP-4-amino-4,6-dideoxygalactose transaminase
VFVDIDRRHVQRVARRGGRGRRPRTKAVVAVDLFGQMAPLEQVTAAAPGLPVIEDAAQSIGASRVIDGERRMAGEAATIGTFSFFPSKNLGGYGDGGMMVTQDERLFERLMRLRTHGSRKTYYHEEVGYNSRLDALQAAVLRAKLPHLAAWSARRRENAAYYDAAFADVPGIRTPTIDPRTSRSTTSTRSAPSGATRCRSTSRGAESARRCTTRCRCTCSRASRTSATRPGAAPRPSARRAR